MLRSLLRWPSLVLSSRVLRGDERGTVAIVSAVFFTVAIAATALAVDAGSLYLERRQAQNAADLAAIAAARDVAHAESAARATLRSNGIPNPQNLAIVLGHYVPDVNLAAAARFTPAATPYNAARVTFSKAGRIYFSQTFVEDCCNIQVSALGATPGLATFSLGSGLLSLENGAINALLKGTLGGTVNLSVMDYNALVGGKVKLFDFLDALATELNVTAGSYDDVLATSAKSGHVLKALARVSQKNGDTAAVTVLDKLLLQSTAMTKSLNLSSLLGLDPSVADAAIGSRPTGGKDATFSVMDLVHAAAVLSDGSKQVDLGADASLPGIKLSLALTIGEPMQTTPWAAVGQQGSIIRTAQTKIRVNLEITAGIVVKVPLDIDMAYAEGRLANVACAADSSGTVTVGAKPGIVKAVIGGTSSANKVDIATVPIPLLGGVAVTAYTPIAYSAGNTTETLLTFTQAQIDAAQPQTASTTSLVAPLTGLVGNLKLGARLGGLEIAVPALVTSTIGGILNPVTAASIDALVFKLLEKAGVTLGRADVIVRGVRCDAALAG